MARRHGARRRENFFKVQKWDERIGAWVDARKKSFDSLAEAEAYAAASDKGVKVRILQYADGTFTKIGS